MKTKPNLRKGGGNCALELSEVLLVHPRPSALQQYSWERLGFKAFSEARLLGVYPTQQRKQFILFVGFPPSFPTSWMH